MGHQRSSVTTRERPSKINWKTKEAHWANTYFSYELQTAHNLNICSKIIIVAYTILLSSLNQVGLDNPTRFLCAKIEKKSIQAN
jgi:hypothetical protein